MTTLDPSVVGSEQCSDDTPTTFCDLDIVGNVWVEGVVDLARGNRGCCMLDTLTKDQVVYILQHDPQARIDLLKVTSNEELRRMVAEVPLLSRTDPADAEQHNQVTAGLPFYTVFRGQPPTPSGR